MRSSRRRSPAAERRITNRPVATPSLTLSHDKVPIGSPVKLTYKFVVAPDAKFSTDYWVFVHVLDPTGEQLWTDDHLPTPPTSAWKPGQTVEYTRTVFVPNYPYIGEASVRLGLYDRTTTNRLTLNAPQVGRARNTWSSKFQLQPQSENIFLILQGWLASGRGRDRQRRLGMAVDEEDRHHLIQEPQERLDLLSGVRRADRPVHPAAAGDHPDWDRDHRHIRRRTAGSGSCYTFPITAAQLGSGDMTEIVIDLDRTFSPGSGDVRELGIRVFHAFVEPK